MCFKQLICDFIKRYGRTCLRTLRLRNIGSAGVRVALIQRSCGYSLRPTLTIKEIARLVKVIKGVKPECFVLVDNCYGEFTEDNEPGMVGLHDSCPNTSISALLQRSAVTSSCQKILMDNLRAASTVHVFHQDYRLNEAEAIKLTNCCWCEEQVLRVQRLKPFSVNCRDQHPFSGKGCAQAGADLCMGSLIKSPGGSLVTGGGYIAGNKHLVAQAGARLTAPGIGLDSGAVPGETTRLMFQGPILTTFPPYWPRMPSTSISFPYGALQLKALAGAFSLKALER